MKTVVLLALILANACALRSGLERRRSSLFPFASVDGLVLGHSRYRDAVRRFGEPEVVAEGQNFVACFRSRGICLILTLPPERNPEIDSIYVEDPYDGSTPEGLRLGQAEKESRVRIAKSFVVTDDLGDSLFLAPIGRPSQDDFQVWFEGGKLARMKVYGKVAPEIVTHAADGAWCDHEAPRLMRDR